MTARYAALTLLLLWPRLGAAQESSGGFEMPLTLSGGAFVTSRTEQPPRSASRFTSGARAVAYPTLRLNRHWFFSGAVQFHSRPYFFDEFGTQGYGAKTDILQAYVGYERFWGRNFLSVRAGQLSSAFGSFLLRYDDAVNPLVGTPLAYGYYYGSPVTNLGLTGAQVDATLGKIDLRAQLTNSSPTNRRTIFDHDQYGSWTGGVGYTFFQGFRAGASAFRGPYLHREFPFYFPGELPPRELPATGVGLDVDFARGHWNVRGELQRFQNTYVAIPNFTRVQGYVEVKYAFHPRWYASSRVNRATASAGADRDIAEVALGYRLSRLQLVKVGYQYAHSSNPADSIGNVFAVQLVTNLKPVSIAWGK